MTQRFSSAIALFAVMLACSHTESTPTETDGKQVLEDHLRKTESPEGRVLSFKKNDGILDTKSGRYCMEYVAEITRKRRVPDEHLVKPQLPLSAPIAVRGTARFEKSEKGWRPIVREQAVHFGVTEQNFGKC